MQNNQDALAALILITGIVVIVFIISRYTYLIKKAMIENGLTAPSTSKKLQYLDLGSIVAGLGLGLIISSIFTTMELSENTADLLVWGAILIGGSIGLIAAHFLRRKFGN